MTEPVSVQVHGRRALMVLPPLSGSFSGTRNVIISLIPRLSAIGWDVHTAELPHVPPPTNPAAVRAHVAASVASVQRSWADWRPDVVHVEYPDPAGAGVMQAARAAGIAVTGDFHHIHLHLPTAQRPRVLALVCQAFAVCDAVFTETLQGLGNLHGHGISQAVYLPRGVDGERFHPRYRDPAMRCTWGVQADEPVLLSFGRMIPIKRLDRFVIAAEALRHAVPSARVVLIGEGSEEPMLRRLMPWAHFLGPMHGPALAAAVASCDVFAFPSPEEPFGNASLEAAAAGVAVVAARSGAAAEILGPDGSLLSDPDDPLGFIADVVALGRDPARRQAVASAARQRMADLSWEAIAARWSAVWQGILARRHS